jgi:hypothetical protein
MPSISLALIRERKQPADNRVALTPDQCREVLAQYKSVQIKVEPSSVRCYWDEAYKAHGIPVTETVADANWLLGVKEVPPPALIPEKTYSFFSHTIKQQPHNRALLQTVLERKIRLIDLELLTDEAGNRLIGFGNYAGIVGAHYALMMQGERHNAYHLPAAHQMPNYDALVKHVQQFRFPPFQIAIAGAGRVGRGARHYLYAIGFREVDPETFRTQKFDQPVFTLLKSSDLYERKDKQPFNKGDFKANPSAYQSIFHQYIPYTDVLINAVYWDQTIPRHFEPSDTRTKDFQIQTIADVSCDLEGAVPITTRHSTSADPVYGYDPVNSTPTKPYQKGVIDLMAISNLPNELPCDASADFGAVMRDTMIPAFVSDPWQRLFRDATIAYQGELMPDFAYLADYVAGD